MDLKPLFNNFITSGMKSQDLETVNRVKVLNLFLLILTVGAPLFGIFYFFIGADFLFYATAIAAVLWVLDILLLRWTKNINISGNFAFFIFWATLLVIKWNTGGMSTGSLMLLSWIWNAVLILMAVFITGYLGGTIWTTVIFIETGVLIHLFRIGYQFPNLIPFDISPAYSLGAYLSGLLVILVIAFVYEKEKDDVADRVDDTSRALVESKRYIDTIIAASPVPTFVIDTGHRVIQWNRALQEMTGIPEETMAGKKVHNSLYADNQWSLADIILEKPDSIEERFSESIVSKTDNGAFQMEMHFPAIQEGIRAMVTVVPIVGINGSIKGAIETIQNVSNLSREKYTLHDSIKQAVERSPYPIFSIGSTGKINFWNKACEKYFGYSFSQMAGKSPLTLVAKPMRKSFRETVIEVFRGATRTGKEWKYYSAQGEPRYALASAYPIQAGDRKSKECVVVNTDIADLKSRMNELERNETEANERLKSLTGEYTLLRKNLAAYIRGKSAGGFHKERDISKLKEDMKSLKEEVEDL
ncbi:MAG: PAS domain S-box protein [Deltaproteobacteria bacterium]|nr:PAS domain S-box protein [Deltaproteobacteria bacterium]MBW2339060.1 PAS domain S-box protein [Deltaproteobacteria bacterium]